MDPAASANRQGFLDQSATLRDELDDVHVEDFTPAERAEFDRMTGLWDSFFAEDEKVVAMFREGTPAAITRANAHIVGPAYDVYFALRDSTQTLIDAVQSAATPPPGLPTPAPAAPAVRRWPQCSWRCAPRRC